MNIEKFAGKRVLLEGGGEAGCDIQEADARDRLLQVEGARAPVGPFSVPVKHAEGGVAVLLNFGNEAASADGVAAAPRDIERIARLDGDPMEKGLHRTRGQGCFKPGPGEGGVKASVDRGVGFCGENVPPFIFGFAKRGSCFLAGRVHLDGERFAGVEEF